MLENLEDRKDTPRGALFGLMCSGMTLGYLGCESFDNDVLPTPCFLSRALEQLQVCYHP